LALKVFSFSECVMAKTEQELAAEIGKAIEAFCKEQSVSLNDLSAVKRKLLGHIKKHWPEAGFTVINRALSLAYEDLLAAQHKRGVAIIDALRRSN
jgi:hypothetical protein